MSNKNIYEDLVNVLKSEVRISLGCTEPIAVALAVAKSKELIKSEVESVQVIVSPNIYKNGMKVMIPKTHKRGLYNAAALGVTGGKSQYGLELLKDLSEEEILLGEEMVEKGLISMEADYRESFYIQAIVKGREEVAKCIIKGNHTNIVYLSHNEEVIVDEECPKGSGYGKIQDYSVREIIDFSENVDFDKIEFLLEGIEINMDMAQRGLKNKKGLGSILLANGSNSGYSNKIRAYTAAACDARMSGESIPVVSSAGSGNHGIIAVIVPSLIGREEGFSQEKMARTLAISHLLTSYIKSYTGRLSPICGCAVAAGIGATASITWARSYDYDMTFGSIKNMIGTLAGLICDGAKEGCAFKISVSAGEAILQSDLARAGMIIQDGDGIIEQDIDQSIRNLGSISKEGMGSMDREIIKILSK